jgi:hypothetical protein
MPNPTCPTCHAPQTATNVLPFVGGVVIYLECPYWHTEAVWLPRSRFVSNEIIALPDGYNGDTVDCYVDPIEIDGNLAKLRVVGRSYMFKWTMLEDLDPTPLLMAVAGVGPVILSMLI